MSQARKGGLGRGLAALIPTGPANGGPGLGSAAADVIIGVEKSNTALKLAGAPDRIPDSIDEFEASPAGAVYREIPHAQISPNPKQPRQVSTTSLWRSSFTRFASSASCSRSLFAAPDCKATNSSWVNGVGERARKPDSRPSRRSFAKQPMVRCCATHSSRTSTECS